MYDERGGGGNGLFKSFNGESEDIRVFVKLREYEPGKEQIQPATALIYIFLVFYTSSLKDCIDCGVCLGHGDGLWDLGSGALDEDVACGTGQEKVSNKKHDENQRDNLSNDESLGKTIDPYNLNKSLKDHSGP